MSGVAAQADAAQIALADQVRRGQCILFLGAGVHAPPPEDSPYKYPVEHRPLLGGALAEKLAEACGYPDQLPNEPLSDLQRVSLCFEKTPGLGRAKLVDFLTLHLMASRRPSPALKMLAALPFKIIVTTNYDRLLEVALRKTHRDKDPVVLVYNPDSSKPTPDPTDDPTEDRPLVFKMHGDLDHTESIVITDEDYITFVQRMADKEACHPVPQTIRFRMVKWSTLFLGYSLRDYNLRLLFRTLRWRIDTAAFPASFSVDRSPDPLILKVWQNERQFITFVTEDLWSFVPWLYKTVVGAEYTDG